MKAFENGEISGYSKNFKDAIVDEDLRQSIFTFLAENEEDPLEKVGQEMLSHVCVRWPDGRLENWFAAQRIALEIESEVLKADPKAKRILEQGDYTIISEEDYEYLAVDTKLNGEDTWETVSFYHEDRIVTDVSEHKVGAGDRMSASRIEMWCENFTARWFKGLMLPLDIPLELVVLMRRPTEFVERRRMKVTPIVQMGAVPCKLKDSEYPRWPQGDPAIDKDSNTVSSVASPAPPVQASKQ